MVEDRGLPTRAESSAPAHQDTGSRVTIATIAAQAGVSVATVSKVRPRPKETWFSTVKNQRRRKALNARFTGERVA